MTILRPLLLMNGHRRNTSPLEVPGVLREETDAGTLWGFSEDGRLVLPDSQWVLSGHKFAEVLDLANHAYMIYCLEGEDQLRAIAQEDWPPSGGVICPLAWVDSHHDLTPRLLSPLLPYVWVTTSTDGLAYLYTTDGTATGWARFTVSGVDPIPLLQVGQQIWMGQPLTNSIARINLDGSSAGPDLTGNGISGPYGLQQLLIVGTEVWGVQQFNNCISRWAFDGTPIGSPLTDATMAEPRQMLIVGTDVWVAAQSGLPNLPIHRFAFDGTHSDAFDPSGNTDTDGTLVIGRIGTEVWAVQTAAGWSGSPRSWGPGNIWRMHPDGTSAGPVSTDATIKEPNGIVQFAGLAWSANQFGDDAAHDTNNTGSVAIYNPDGTPAATNPLIDTNNLSFPTEILVYGAHVWVKSANGTYVLYNADASLYRVIDPTQRGEVDTSVLGTMPLLPSVTLTQPTPSGGSSGDGVNTLGLTSVGTMLTVTTDVDIGSTVWYLVIFDETHTVLTHSAGGMILSFGAWEFLGGVSHTYQAALSTSPSSLVSAVAFTNTVAIAWPGAARPASSMITNDSPSGGSAGDGTNTTSLIGTHGTEGIALLTATTNIDVATHGWHLLIVDETNAIAASGSYGTALTAVIGGTAATTHTYHALLSTSGTAIVSPQGVTNTVIATWP